ncbi:uncharacterized protein NPIL_702241 [Nephila pilipes]|uniref:Uncharacterized protein n=1 Tax=Nephila pilipes TaxID=299642 RepID=A0A8X6N4D5_NEPPI|nr:uncharacterized protein NPIL_702241 [Nephila pilipes]
MKIKNKLQARRKKRNPGIYSRRKNRALPCFSCVSIPVSDLNKSPVNLPSSFFTLLRVADLTEDSNECHFPIKRFVFYAVLLLSCCQIMVEYATDFYEIVTVLTIPILASLVCNLTSWGILRHKRHKLTRLVMKLKHVPASINTKRSNFVAFVFILCFPLAYSALYTYDCAMEITGPIEIYGMEIENPVLQMGFISVSKYLQFFIDLTLPCSIAYLYCTLCLYCSSGIEILTQQIARNTPETFGPREQISILRRKAQIDDVLDDLQKVFSLPAFLAILSSLMTCGDLLVFKLIFNRNNLLTIHLIEVVFYGVAGVPCLTVTLWLAGGLLVELNNLKEAFYKMAHARFLFFHASNEPNCKGEMLEKPEFVLMGCNILPYRRSSILTLVGILLTYTVLITQMWR